jgi:WD40 repeat protein
LAADGSLTLDSTIEGSAPAAFSPDGKQLYFVHTSSPIVNTLDVTTRAVKPTRVVGSGVTRDFFTFSGDGSRLLVADRNLFRIYERNPERSIRVWSSNTVLRGPIVASPDNDTFAVAAHGAQVRLVDARTGELRSTCAHQSSADIALQYAPDGSRLATSGPEGVVQLWDPRGKQEMVPLRGHTAAVRGLTYSPDGRVLASAGMDRTLRLWDTESHKELVSLPLPDGKLDQISLVFTPDGKHLLASSGDSFRTWALEKPLGPALARNVAPIDYSRPPPVLRKNEVTRLVEPLENAGTVIRDSKSVKVRFRNPPTGIIFVPKSTRLAVVGDGMVIWDPEKKDPEKQPEAPGFGWESLGIVDGRVMRVHIMNNSCRLIDGESGRVEASFDTRSPIHGFNAYTYALSGDGRTIALSQVSRHVYLYQRDAKEPRTINLSSNKGYLEHSALSPDGKLLAVCLQNGVKVFDVATLKELHDLQAHADRTMVSQFSPDSKLLASGGVDGRVMVWDLATGKLKQTFKGHFDAVNTIAFAPNGRWLVSGAGGSHRAHGSRGEVRGWDIADAKNHFTLLGQNAGIRSVAVSSDGKSVGAAAGDWMVHVWDVAKVVGE